MLYLEALRIVSAYFKTDIPCLRSLSSILGYAGTSPSFRDYVVWALAQEHRASTSKIKTQMDEFRNMRLPTSDSATFS